MTAATFLFNKLTLKNVQTFKTLRNSKNWKLWAVASVAATVLVGFNLLCNPNCVAEAQELNDAGSSAEKMGFYKAARADFDLAILRARVTRDKELLAQALLNGSRIDSYFEEDKLATSLAAEALGIYKQIYGDDDIHSALAMVAVADAQTDDEFAIKLYKTAIPTLKAEGETSKIALGQALRELAYCYENTNQKANAISACNAALRIFESAKNEHPNEYAQSIIQYTNVLELDNSEKANFLRQALVLQEQYSGNSHPELSATLTELAFCYDTLPDKAALLERALKIDDTTFGELSIQSARDLANLVSAYADNDKKNDPSSKVFRTRLQAFIDSNNSLTDKMSEDFLQSYSTLLHDLHFEKDANRVDKILAEQFGFQYIADLDQNIAKAKSMSLNEQDAGASSDAESDPEDFWRAKTIPVINAKNFATNGFDYVQVKSERGTLTLEAYSEGELVWTAPFAKSSTDAGEQTIIAGADTLEVKTQVGDGPVWNKQLFKIQERTISLQKTSQEDAYCLMLSEQLNKVLSGQEEAASDGTVQSVPVQYLNNNYLKDVLSKGEAKALDHYGKGDAFQAAQTLCSIFDLSLFAINTQRDEMKAVLTEPDVWLDAWKSRKLNSQDYITALNDYGFFLQQSGRCTEAVRVLEAVAAEAPERAVAFLNLGDALWGADDKLQSLNAYQRYVQLGKNNGHAIPTRVLQRMQALELKEIADSTIRN